MKHFTLALALCAALFANPATAQPPALDAAFAACNVTGSVTLYDAQTNRWIFTDEADADRRTLPASTFKIVNSLIALETGATTMDEVFKWDGTKHDIDAWNADTDLSGEFTHSVVWVHEILGKRIGPQKHRDYLQKMHYGNDILNTGRNGNFWVYGDFGVTPREQIDMLRNLHAGTLPFTPDVMASVKTMMHQPSENGRMVYAKTGMVRQNDTLIGWWVGYTEGDAPMFFATRIEKPATQSRGNFITCRKTITDAALAAYAP